jgi:hypothetical protein
LIDEAVNHDDEIGKKEPRFTFKKLYNRRSPDVAEESLHQAIVHSSANKRPWNFDDGQRTAFRKAPKEAKPVEFCGSMLHELAIIRTF